MTRQCVELGFTAVKFGYGPFGRDRALDLALLDAIVAAARGSADVMVDAGRAWETAESIERSRELFERYPLVWLEEPLHEDNLEGYRALASAVSGRIAAGETEATIEAFDALLERGVKVLQPDVGRAGALAICREASERAAQTGAWAIPHCFGTGVNLAASLHWAASAPEAPFIEFPLTSSDLRNKVVSNAPRAEGGFAIVPDGPGLGIAIDTDVVRRYRQA